MSSKPFIPAPLPRAGASNNFSLARAHDAPLISEFYQSLREDQRTGLMQILDMPQKILLFEAVQEVLPHHSDLLKGGEFYQSLREGQRAGLMQILDMPQKIMLSEIVKLVAAGPAAGSGSATASEVAATP